MQLADGRGSLNALAGFLDVLWLGATIGIWIVYNFIQMAVIVLCSGFFFPSGFILFG